MQDKDAFDFVLSCLQESGVKVIMDKAKMEDALAQSGADAMQDELIQKLVFSYAEGDRAPDLTPSSVTFKDKDGKESTMYSVKFYGDRPKDYVPKKIGKAYKLMEQWPDGTLHALFAGTQEVHAMHEWNWAKGFVPDEGSPADKNFKGIKTMKLAPRFGWHMGTGVPSTHHLMGVGDLLHPTMCYPTKYEAGHPKGSKRVWVEVHYDATCDYTPVAEQNPSKKEKDIRGLVPFGGYYMFQESNLSNWIVASSIEFDRIIPEEERQQILRDAGFNEELVWRVKTLRKHLKAGVTACLTKLSKKPSDEQIKRLHGIIGVIRDNEAKIAAISEGKEPAYAQNQLAQLEAAAKTLLERPADFQQVLSRVKDAREVVQQSFQSQHPEQKQRRLTMEEVHAEQDRIRESVSSNPDYLDKEASLLLTGNHNPHVYGFLKGGIIYLDPEQCSAGIPLHEYTHLWDRMVQKENPSLWQEGVALMKQTKLWHTVKKSPFYADIQHDDNLVASEVHARLVALHGKKMLREAANGQGLIHRLSLWGRRFWKTVRQKIEKHTKMKSPLCTMDFIQAPLEAVFVPSRMADYRKKLEAAR